MRHGQVLAALKPSQQKASFDASILRKGRRLDLSMQPDQRFALGIRVQIVYQIWYNTKDCPCPKPPIARI